MFAVSDGLQDADKNVIEDERQRAHKINPEIQQGIGQDVCRCAHPDQHLRSEDQTDDRQQNTGDNPEGNIRMDCTLQTVDLSCSIIAGDYNACAHCDTVEKSNHQKNQTSGRTDGSECVAAEKVADDQGVGGIIKLLEQISEKKRKCEGDDLFPDRSFCHQSRRCRTVHLFSPESNFMFFS